jgi:hypothetical protein
VPQPEPIRDADDFQTGFVAERCTARANPVFVLGEL